MRATLISVLTLAVLLLYQNAPAQPITLRYGQIPSTIKTVSALHFQIAQRKGLFAREGINLEMIPIDGGAANMVVALTKGSRNHPHRDAISNPRRARRL